MVGLRMHIPQPVQILPRSSSPRTAVTSIGGIGNPDPSGRLTLVEKPRAAPVPVTVQEHVLLVQLRRVENERVWYAELAGHPVAAHNCALHPQGLRVRFDVVFCQTLENCWLRRVRIRLDVDSAGRHLAQRADARRHVAV